MKRLLAICVCFFMCVGLCSCDSSQTRSVSSYNWSLEFITDLDGNMLFSGSVHDDIPVLDLTLSFEEKSFILTDNTHKQEWTGTYSLEKIDNSSSKLGLTFENLEEPVTGVYGTRVYSDDSESATITLQTDENILSFVGELKKKNPAAVGTKSYNGCFYFHGLRRKFIPDCFISGDFLNSFFKRLRSSCESRLYLSRNALQNISVNC